MSYDNNNQGAIFKNDRKAKDTDPEYKGSVTVGGVEYWVSVWLNETKDGRKYFSHKYTPKGVTAQHQASIQQAQKPVFPEPKTIKGMPYHVVPSENDNAGDDLPF